MGTIIFRLYIPFKKGVNIFKKYWNKNPRGYAGEVGFIKITQQDCSLANGRTGPSIQASISSKSSQGTFSPPHNFSFIFIFLLFFQFIWIMYLNILKRASNLQELETENAKLSSMLSKCTCHKVVTNYYHYVCVYVCFSDV